MPEISFNDGSYLTEKGNALIGKLLASEGTLKFTKVTAGDGSIPSGKSPEGMTELGNYVTDGLIASVSSSATGEASVVVQISSIDLAQGFSCTELGLWAEDPDEGDILYAYLYLQQHPEWIRADADARKQTRNLHHRHHRQERCARYGCHQPRGIRDDGRPCQVRPHRPQPHHQRHHRPARHSRQARRRHRPS